MTKYAKSASVYISDDSEADVVAVGGVVMATFESQAHVLLVQRAANDGRMAGLWEVPGGGCEDTDPTLLHSTAREVFEESSLHLTGVTDMLGEYRFKTRSGRRCLKLNFLIQVQELRVPVAVDGIPVEVDPAEHQAFAWVPEAQLPSDQHPITSEEQLLAIQQGFKIYDGRSKHASV